MKLSIIIVNWNSGLLLRACVDSVRSSIGSGGAPEAEIIVVDNASRDDSIALADLGSSAHLIVNATNRGFGAACNQGAQLATGAFLLFLNPDCELHAGAVEASIAALEDPTQRTGVCGVRLVDAQGATWRMAQRAPTLYTLLAKPLGLGLIAPGRQDHFLRDWDHLSDRDVDNVIGAFYMISSTLFRQLGGFDERFFVYWEDVDLSLRVQRAGYRVRYLAGATTYHQGGGTSDQVKAARLFYGTRSRLLFAFKHLPRWQAWLHAIVSLVLEPLSRSAQALLRGSLSGVQETWRGFGMLYRDLPKTVALALQR